MISKMKRKGEAEITLGYVGITALVIIGIVLLVIVTSSFYTVQAGEKAIVLRFGDPQPIAYDAGLHFKFPIIDRVVHIDIKTLKYEALASAASQDLQTVSTNVAVNYHLSQDSVITLYREIGLDYTDKIIQPAVQEVVKSVTAKYTAEQLITKRAEVKDAIDAKLRERLIGSNIIVETISITNFDFSSSFNAAIEAKVTTEQNALAAKNKLAQVEYEAQQRIAQAEGEARAIKIQAEAIQSQGGKEYVQLQAISKWDGKLPQYNLGSTTPFIDITPKATA